MTVSFDPVCKGRYVFIKHQVFDHLPEKGTRRLGQTRETMLSEIRPKTLKNADKPGRFIGRSHKKHSFLILFQSHSITKLLLLRIMRMECALTHLKEMLIRYMWIYLTGFCEDVR